jgi:hypothetical protein
VEDTVPEPLPDRFTTLGVLIPLSVIVTAPEIDPVFVGVKVTVTLQASLAAIEPPQVSVSA